MLKDYLLKILFTIFLLLVVFVILKDIVEAVEGPYHVVSCLKQGACPATAGCVSRDVFATVNKSILASLAQHSLDSISHTTHRV